MTHHPLPLALARQTRSCDEEHSSAYTRAKSCLPKKPLLGGPPNRNVKSREKDRATIYSHSASLVLGSILILDIKAT
jgi:hypothetical protein